jgi:hypothetical protein
LLDNPPPGLDSNRQQLSIACCKATNRERSSKSLLAGVVVVAVVLSIPRAAPFATLAGTHQQYDKHRIELITKPFSNLTLHSIPNLTSPPPFSSLSSTYNPLLHTSSMSDTEEVQPKTMAADTYFGFSLTTFYDDVYNLGEQKFCQVMDGFEVTLLPSFPNDEEREMLKLRNDDMIELVSNKFDKNMVRLSTQRAKTQKQFAHPFSPPFSITNYINRISSRCTAQET